MKTITEDYCSYEVAKLLKEKGFDEKVSTHYLVHPSGFSEFFDKKDEFPEPEDVWLKCPTHQLAMKWLREVHHIAINIGWGEIFEGQYQWWCIVLNMDNGNILYEINYHASYEEACEAALKYVLENLI